MNSISLLQPYDLSLQHQWRYSDPSTSLSRSIGVSSTSTLPCLCVGFSRPNCCLLSHTRSKAWTKRHHISSCILVRSRNLYTSNPSAGSGSRSKFGDLTEMHSRKERKKKIVSDQNARSLWKDGLIRRKRRGCRTVVFCDYRLSGQGIGATDPDNSSNENNTSHSRSSFGSDTGGLGHETQCSSTLESSEQIECNCFENENEHVSSLEHLRATLKSTLEELELARLKSLEIERETQVITERAISLRDEADLAASKVENAKSRFEKLSNEELSVEDLIVKAKDSLSRAQENYRCAQKSSVDAPEGESKDQLVVDPEKDIVDNKQAEDFSIEDCVSGSIPPFLADSSEMVNIRGKIQEEKEQEILGLLSEEGNLIAYEAEVKGCEMALAQYEMDLQRIKASKSDLQKELLAMLEAAKKARESAMEGDYEVAKVMSLAEQAVASEVDATQRVSVAEIALQKAEKLVLCETVPSHSTLGSTSSRISEKDSEGVSSTTAAYGTAAEGIHLDNTAKEDNDSSELHTAEDGKPPIAVSDEAVEVTDKVSGRGPEAARVEVGMLLQETESEKPKNVHQEKDNVKESSPHVGIPKSKRSSRFFSASFFSFNDDESEFTPSNLFSGIQQNFLKISVGILLLCGGSLLLKRQIELEPHMTQRTEFVITFEEASSSAKPLMIELQKLPLKARNLLEKIPQELHEEETSLFDVLWLLLASVIFVPLFQKLPGGSPVLGYLIAGVLIGPHSLSIIQNVHATKTIAEFGVVFLLFNIGLELSVERLSSMKKYVFGLGTSQVLATALVVGLCCRYICGFSGPAALVIGNGLALSSTAVVLQVLQERGEGTSRHGRATFSVLLFQDIAVVVLLILIPLISPNSSKGGVGFQAIAEALGIAAVKGVMAIGGIIAGGRLLLRPIYKRMADNQNAEIFAANTLFVVLGTSVLTARAGLSMALGAFLAGLLLAETEFSLQVESDIAPYRGLLLGLFFMTVGMSIDPKLFISEFPIIIGGLSMLLIGKTVVVACIGRLFGLSPVAAVRAGLLLAPGGEFAFVAFGEAVNQRIMTSGMSSLLFLIVGLSMALTPWLGALGQSIASRFQQQDVLSLLPAETETDDLQGHIIICGFGRVGQIISQLLSDCLIPFVAVDVRSERVTVGRALDFPVYFGDAGSKEVLHKLGAERASCAVITLNTPGANYRTVWALSKHFPNVKTFVRAHDVEHGINLEKAGATAVVPETLEPSLQLAAAVLAQVQLPAAEIAATIDEFRSGHLSELTELSEISGGSLGYGFSQTTRKPKPQAEPGKARQDDDGRGEAWKALVAP